MTCFDDRCRRKPTHDLCFTEVQARDDSGERLWRERGLPVKVPGVLRLIRGEYGCRDHVARFAEQLNARR